MTLGERVKSLRQKAGLTQEELAKEIGYATKTSISKIENYILDINQSTIVALARALKTTPSVIMGWAEPYEKINPQGNLYKRIEGLYKEKGITITQMCKDCGASRGSLGDLANNRIQSLSANTLQKIASYLSVSIDELVGNEMNYSHAENNVVSKNVIDKDIRRIKRAKNDMTDEEWERFMMIAKLSFKDYFSDDYVDDDNDE